MAPTAEAPTAHLAFARIAPAICMAITATAAVFACAVVCRSAREDVVEARSAPSWLLPTQGAAAAAITIAVFLGGSFESLAHANRWFVIQPFVAALGLLVTSAALRRSTTTHSLWLGALTAVAVESILIFAPYLAEPVSHGRFWFAGLLGVAGGATALISSVAVVKQDSRVDELPAAVLA